MSKPLAIRLRDTLATSGLAIALTLASVAALDAQTNTLATEAERFRRQYEGLEARRAELSRVADSLERRVSGILNDSVVAGGKTLRFVRGQVDSVDLAALLEGAARGRAQLTTQYGPQARLIVDTTPWDIEVSRWQRFRSTRLRAELVAKPRDPYARRRMFRTSLPLNADSVASWVRQEAAAQLRTLHPTVAAYVLTHTATDATDQAWELAARNLLVNESSLSYRCYAGSIADCRRVLALGDGRPTYVQYYEPHDWPRLALRVRLTEQTPPEQGTDRKACNEARDLVACERLFAQRPPNAPVAEVGRSTLIAVALEQSGGAGLDRLVAARGQFADDPFGLLAHVANQSEDALLSAWQARLRAVGVEAVAVSVVPVLLTTMAWSGLLFGVVALRRPR